MNECLVVSELDIDNKNIFFYPFTEPTLPSTIKETTPETRLAANSPQSENGMIPVEMEQANSATK